MPAIVSKIAQYPHRFVAFAALLIIFATIPLSAVVVFSTIQKNGAKARAATTIDITATAVQAVHQTSVPHTDVWGNFRNSFDSTSSFLPIGIYNPTLCQVTKFLSWPAKAGYTGEYRIKINYGSSRAAGTYLLADINIGTGASGTVGNLPPSSQLYYSIWLNNTSTVISEAPFTSDACTNVGEDTNFKNVTNGGFNTAILEKNIYPDTNVLSKAQASGVKLVLDMRDRPSNIFTNLKDNPNVAGFYVGDDDLAKIKYYNQDPTSAYNSLKAFADSIDSQTSKVVLEAEPDIDSTQAQTTTQTTTGNLTYSWGRPTGFVSFVDVGNKTASCSGTATTCSTATYTYWPGSTVNYTVKVSSASGPVLKTASMVVTADGRAVADWNWKYAAVTFPSSYADCIAAGTSCKTQSISNDSTPVPVTFTNLPVGTYKEIACAPDCGTGVSIFNTTGTVSSLTTSAVDWQDWYKKFDAVGNVSFHYNYPKSNSSLFPWKSISGVADTVKHQVRVNGSNRPSWFIAQAINLKWVIPLEFPTAAENRAMVYTALVHGATGIFQFSHDDWFRRQPKGSPAPENQNDINWYDRHAGIKKTTPASYSGGDKWAYGASASETAASMDLWKGIDASQGGLNKELQQLRPVILSPTSADSYKVFVDQTPISAAPVRTILKNFNGEYYLFAVNIDNASITANFNLTGKNFEKAEVMFENRTATISGGNSVTETFAPFDVNIYKLTPASVQSSLVGSQRKVCSLLGANQTAVGIGGQDAGTSVGIGSESFWTFGDTLNTSKGLFLPNNIAKTSDLDAADCVTLNSKASGGVAQALLNKVAGEIAVWPDGMVNVASGTGHFFFMSVRACSAPEPCAFGSLGAWKVKGIGLAKFDTAGMNSTRVGGLFWQESDNNGFEIAGATAVVDSGYVYVFLNESPDGVNQYAARIARVPVANVENKVSYQYWNGSSWVSDIKSSARVMTFPGAFNGVSVAYNQFLGKWTAIYTTGDFSKVAVKTASSITGPWSTGDEVLVDCASVFPTENGLKCYFGRQHPEYAKGNGQTIYVTYTNQESYQVFLHEIVLKATDTDEDGFLDTVEEYIGTDPNSSCGVDTWPPDYDNSGKVDYGDFTILLNHWNGKIGNTKYDKRYDLAADGKIDYDDFVIIQNLWNKRKCAPTPTLTPTPSPSLSPSPTDTPSASPSATPSPTATPIAAGCTLGQSSVAVGGLLTVTGSGFSGTNLPLSIIGAFGTPVVSLGVFNGTNATVTIPQTQAGLYRVRADEGSGNFVYCTPDLAIS